MLWYTIQYSIFTTHILEVFYQLETVCVIYYFMVYNTIFNIHDTFTGSILPTRNSLCKLLFYGIIPYSIFNIHHTLAKIKA